MDSSFPPNRSAKLDVFVGCARNALRTGFYMFLHVLGGFCFEKMCRLGQKIGFGWPYQDSHSWRFFIGVGKCFSWGVGLRSCLKSNWTQLPFSFNCGYEFSLYLALGITVFVSHWGSCYWFFLLFIILDLVLFKCFYMFLHVLGKKVVARFWGYFSNM